MAGTIPPVEQVRPDLWSVPVPIPDNPLRYTLTYVMTAGSGLVVVDPGWDTEPAWRALTQGLATAGASAADVTGIVVTHIHPDHHGLSARLRSASGAWVAMHPAERDSLRALRWKDGQTRRDDQAWLRGCGVPDEVAAEIGMRDEADHPFSDMAEPDILLEHGELVPLPGRRVRAVWTPGHTPGHLCLHDEAENLLLTGDHVLPRISPNIGLQPHAAEPPLATTWQVTRELSWSRGWPAVTGFMRRAALAEAGAHLQYLADGKRVAAADARGDEARTYSLSLPE